MTDDKINRQYAAIKYVDNYGGPQDIYVWGPYDDEETAQDRLIQEIQDDIGWDDFVEDMEWETSDDMPGPDIILNFWNEFILGDGLVRVEELRT